MIALTSTDTASTDRDRDRDSKGNSNSNRERGRDRERGEKHFQFVYSAEFARLHDQYNMLASTGDVNRLATFISHHPYHPEGKEQILSYPTLSCPILRYTVRCCAMICCAITLSSYPTLTCPQLPHSTFVSFLYLHTPLHVQIVCRPFRECV